MRYITQDDFIETFSKLKQRGLGFLLSKFSLNESKRTISAFNEWDIEGSNWWMIPAWAYMLLASYLAPQTTQLFMETPEQWRQRELLAAINRLNSEEYAGKRIVVKGCGDEPIPAEAYFEITRKLQPVAKSIMYGEPCSTVPVFKQK